MTYRSPTDRHVRRLRLESLENRCLLAVITVTDLGDGPLAALSGDGRISLREAIEAANADMSVDGSIAGDGADVIEFDLSLFSDGPRSIVLSAGQLSVTNSLAINGPGARLLTIDASGNDVTPLVKDGQGSGIFDARDGDFSSLFSFSLTGLSLTGGDFGSPINTTENLTILDCSIFGNASLGWGGAIDATGSAALRSTLRIERTSLRGNRATASGGAMHVHYSHVLMQDCEVLDNRAYLKGGGLDIWQVNLELENTLISHNTSEESFGGGIVGENSSVVATNSTISFNFAHDSGGIARYGGQVLVSLRQSTVVGNRSERGPGGISRATVTAVGSIIADNEGLLDYDDWYLLASDVAPKLTNCLIGSRGGSALVAAPVGAPDANGNIIGDIGAAIDPLLGPLAFNGGPTLTHAPLPGSPVIDMGDPAAIPDAGDVTAFDQRGNPYSRVVGGRIDIGAVEYQPQPADFDNDGDADGADFLAWQRGQGTPAPEGRKSDGDANADGAIDANDLALWRATFGSQGGAIIAAGSAAYTWTPPLSLVPTDLELIDLAIAKWRSEQASLDRCRDAVHESPSAAATAQPRAIAASMPLNQWSVPAYPSPTHAAGSGAADDAEPDGLAAIGSADLAFFLLGT